MKSPVILRLILGAVLLVFAAPKTMAAEVVREVARADFFCAQNVEEFLTQENLSSTDFEEDGRPAMVSFNDAALLPGAELYEQSETSVEGEQEETGSRKRPNPLQKFVSKCRFSSCLSLKLLARGVARHPLTQDAGQERTATVRFLQLEALPKM